MAFSLSSLSKCLVFLSLLMFASLYPSHARTGIKVAEDQLQKICSLNKDPSFCLASFKSDRRTATADLPGLLRIAIDLADAMLKQNQAKIQALSRSASDPATKKRCQSCLESYNDAIEDLTEARDSLKAKDFESVGANADASGTSVDDCANGELTTPEKPFLPDENDKAFQRCVMVRIVVNQLTG